MITHSDSTRNATNSHINKKFEEYKPHLDEISASLFITAKEIQGKIVPRSTLLKDLENHKAYDTLLKCIVPMRQPQVPKSKEEKFTKTFQEITTMANKATVQALIDIRKEEIEELKESLSKVGNLIGKKTSEAMTFIKDRSSELNSGQKQMVEDLNSEDIKSRLTNQQNKIETISAFSAYHAEEKAKTFEAAKVAKAALATEDTELDKIRKEMQAMKKLITQQDDKPAKKANNQGKKDNVKKFPESKRNGNKMKPSNAKGSKRNKKNQGKGQGVDEERAVRSN